MFPFDLIAETDLNNDGFDTGILWTVLVVLLIVCLIVWLVRNFR